MDTLTNICLDYVAEIAHTFSLKDFEGLPVPVLRELASHLSAFQLNRLNELFSHAGVSTHAVWSAHLTHRWTKSYQRAATLFHDELVDRLMPDPRQVYLERHFQWLLGHLATDSPKDLMRDFHVCLPMMRTQGTYMSMKSSQLFCSMSQNDLILYAPFVRVLSIMATTPAMIDLLLDDIGLLSCLQKSVQRLDLYFVNERNFARSKDLVLALVRHGSVHEFALFSAQLPLQQLTELLDIAAVRSADLKHCEALNTEKVCHVINLGDISESNLVSVTESFLEASDCSNILSNTEETVSDRELKFSTNVPSEALNSATLNFNLASNNLHDVSDKVSTLDSISSIENCSEFLCHSLPNEIDACSSELEASFMSASDVPQSALDSTVLDSQSSEILHSVSTDDKTLFSDVGDNSIDKSQTVNNLDNVDDTSTIVSVAYLLDEYIAGEETVDSDDISEHRLQEHLSCNEEEEEDGLEGLYSWNNEEISSTQDTEDLFDVALLFKNRRPSDANKIHSSSKLYKVPMCSDNNEGCFSLTLAYLKADYVVQEALAHVLPLWASLRKLAILEVNMTNGEVFQKFLAERIGQGRLSHLILYDSYLCQNVLDIVIMSLLNKTSDEPMQEISLTFFDSQVEALSETAMSELREHDFHGTVHLDLSYTSLSEEKVGFIPLWIRQDLALRHLYLSSFQNTAIIPDILTSVLQMSRMETLCFEGVTFSLEMESSLLKVLRQLKSLRSLNLDHCGLSSELVNSREFREGISEHNNLTELHLAYNRLERSGCEIIKSICMNNYDRHKFHFLNLSYNLIDANSLLLVADEIFSNFTRCRSRDCRVFKLNIGGNLFGTLHAGIVQKFLRFVDIVVAEVADLTDVNPLADHLAQM